MNKQTNATVMTAIVVAAFVLIGGLPVQAEPMDFTWDNGDPNDNRWSSADNWDQNERLLGVHGDGDPDLPEQNVIINLSGSDKSVVDNVFGSHSEANGTINDLYVGQGSDNVGELDIVDGAIVRTHKYNNRHTRIGADGGTGTVNQSGGTFASIFGSIDIGIGSGSKGTYNLSGGTLTNSRSGITIGTDGGTGLLNITGGEFTTGGDDLLIGAGGTFRVGGSGALKILTGDGNWDQSASGSTLEALIDDGGITTIEVGGDVRFGSKTELTLGFVDKPVSGIWKLMTWEGDLTDNGLSLTSGVDTDTWHFTIDKEAGTLFVIAVPSEAEPGEDMEPVLLDFLKDIERTIPVRLNAIDALVHLQDASADIHPLLLDLLNRPEEQKPVRLKALRTLLESDVATGDVAPVLLGIVQDTEDTAEVRVAALEALQEAGVSEEKILPVLLAILANTDDAGEVRRAVADDLSTFDLVSGETAPALLDVLRDNDAGETVRREIYNILLGLDTADKDIASALLEALQQAEKPEAVRTVTLLTLDFYRNRLKKISDNPQQPLRNVVPLLLDVLKDGKYADKARQNAQQILARLDNQLLEVKLAGSLLDLLANGKDDDAIRRAVLEGAGVMNVFKGDIDRGAKNPLPETPEAIATYKTHILKKLHRDVCLYPKTVTRISTLSELSEYAGKSGVHVRMEPGVYEVTVDNYEHLRSQKKVLFNFTGSNSAFDLRGVEIKTDSSLPLTDVRIGGSRLIIQGLTITNVGEEGPSGYTLMVKGVDNLLKGMRVYARGSYPYGIMQARGVYQKLARPGHIDRMSKSAAVIGGADRAVFVDDEFYQRGNGHALSWSGDVDYTFIDCLVEGKVRMSDDILNRTEGGFYADMENLSEKTIEGLNNILSPGQIVPLAEDAFRSYSRDGDTLKVLGGSVKKLRNAFKRGSYDTFFISNVYVSGISLPFAFTGGQKIDRIVNCKLDLLNGAIMAIGSNDIDVTLVPPDPNTLPHYSTKKNIQAAIPDGNSGIVYGKDNTVYLRAGENLPIDQVRKRPPLKINGKGTVLHNETGLPIKLSKKSKNCKIITNGKVTDNGKGNTIKRID